VTAAYTARARTLVTKMMFWALAGVTFSAAKIVSCNKKKNFIVYLRHYFNCSTLGYSRYYNTISLGYSIQEP
jgi:hypothetical protein